MGKDKSWTSPPREEVQRAVRLKQINRQQMLLRPVEVEKLVEEDHPVRAIWELVGQLDLGPFYAEIESVEGVAGRPVWDPQLLISLWIYAYKDGVSSAREIARLCEYHPAYQWLTGLEVVNYHTLADFRIRHKEPLDHRAPFGDVSDKCRHPLIGGQECHKRIEVELRPATQCAHRPAPSVDRTRQRQRVDEARAFSVQPAQLPGSFGSR